MRVNYDHHNVKACFIIITFSFPYVLLTLIWDTARTPRPGPRHSLNLLITTIDKLYTLLTDRS